MAFYQAKVLDDNGAHELTISADSLAEATALAARQGRVAYCRKQILALPPRRLTSEEREQLLSQLSYLTGSGLGLGESLRIMQGTYSGRPEQVVGELLTQIEAGVGLPTAMELVGARDFPAATLALIQAGYRSSQGAESLETASAFETQLRKLKQSTGNGLVSAVLGFIGAAVATLASVFYLGPAIKSSSFIAAAGDGVDVRWAEVLGLWTGGFMLLASVGLMALFFVHFVLRRLDPLLADRITLSVPLWRDIALSKERYLAFFSIQTLVAPAVSLEQTFEITAKGTPQGILRDELETACAAIKAGGQWVSALKSLGPVDGAALKGAEDRHQLAKSFQRLADRFRERYSRSRERAAVAMQLIAALCLTISGGVLFALSILPLLQASVAVL